MAVAVEGGARKDIATAGSVSSLSGASKTYTNGVVYLVWVTSWISSGAPAAPSSVTVGTMTFAKVTSSDHVFEIANAASDCRQTLWAAVGDGSTGALTVSWGGVTQSAAFFEVAGFTGAKTTNGGLDAVRQVVSGQNSTANASVTLAALQDANSMVCGHVALQTTSALSAGSGFTAFSQFGISGLTNGKEHSEYESNVTAVAWSNSAPAVNWGAIAWEVAAPTGAKTQTLAGQESETAAERRAVGHKAAGSESQAAKEGRAVTHKWMVAQGQQARAIRGRFLRELLAFIVRVAKPGAIQHLVQAITATEGQAAQLVRATRIRRLWTVAVARPGSHLLTSLLATVGETGSLRRNARAFKRWTVTLAANIAKSRKAQILAFAETAAATLRRRTATTKRVTVGDTARLVRHPGKTFLLILNGIPPLMAGGVQVGARFSRRVTHRAATVQQALLAGYATVKTSFAQHFTQAVQATEVTVKRFARSARVSRRFTIAESPRARRAAQLARSVVQGSRAVAARAARVPVTVAVSTASTVARRVQAIRAVALGVGPMITKTIRVPLRASVSRAVTFTKFIPHRIATTVGDTTTLRRFSPRTLAATVFAPATLRRRTAKAVRWVETVRPQATLQNTKLIVLAAVEGLGTVFARSSLNDSPTTEVAQPTLSRGVRISRRVAQATAGGYRRAGGAVISVAVSAQALLRRASAHAEAAQLAETATAGKQVGGVTLAGRIAQTAVYRRGFRVAIRALERPVSALLTLLQRVFRQITVIPGTPYLDWQAGAASTDWAVSAATGNWQTGTPYLS